MLTLALGIGGSTAMFTLVDSVLLRPLRCEGALGRFVASLLYGVTPTDPTTLVGVACVLTLSSRPSATRVDPMVALRND